MSFRWLQLWGDLKLGLHPSWKAALEAAENPLAPSWCLRTTTGASELRRSLGVSLRWDDDLDVDMCHWVLLPSRDFEKWIEVIGLICLGEHLKRLLALNLIDRLAVSLDRTTLAKVLDYVNQLQLQSGKALPLSLSSARLMGEAAIASIVSIAFPLLWSRLRLRLRQSETSALSDSNQLVFRPSMADLKDIDSIFFGGQSTRPPPRMTNEREQIWNTTRTLSA